MVRPIPPDPPASDHVDSPANDFRGDAGDSEAHSEENRLLGEAALQERLGSGFSLRRNNVSVIGLEGVSLYSGFLNDEFRRRNLPEPTNLFPSDSPFYQMPQPSSSDLIQAGSQLRILSEEFAQSPMRQWVEEQAAIVPLETLDFNAFSELLYGLFQEGGVTWERVVVLFYFCADLAVRAFREKLPGQFQNIVEWSFRFFSGDQMMRWVAEHGGWVKVMQKSVDNIHKLTRIGFFIMGMLAFAAYIWKSR